MKQKANKPEEPLRIEMYRQLLQGMLTAEVSSVIGLSALSSQDGKNTLLKIGLGLTLASLVLLLTTLLVNFIASGTYYNLEKYKSYSNKKDRSKDENFMNFLSRAGTVLIIVSWLSLIIGIVIGTVSIF